MPERLALSRTLWLIVAPPVLGFVWQIARGLARRGPPPGRAGSDPWARRIGVGSVVLASGATLGHALRLARSAGDIDALMQGGVGGLVVGPLDTAFRIRFDALTGSACGVACVAAVAAAAFLGRRPSAERPGRVWAWMQLALAGGLLSFLADGLVTTLLGWAAAGAAAAWLAGWTDARPGAVRATRVALAIVGLLVGQVLRATAGGLDAGAGGALAVVALLCAAAAMSASTPPVGAPLALAALGCGGTTGLVGPFLLLRVAELTPLSLGAGRVVALAGALMTAGVVRQALLRPAGPSRWVAVAGGAPAGVTCISLGADGEKGALLVVVTAGLTAALLLVTAAGRGVSTAVRANPARTDLESALLVRAPEAAGALLLSFERWVVDAIGGAVIVLARASAWALSTFDARRP